MSEPAGNYTDNGVIHGSQKVTIASKPYVFRSIDRQAYDADRQTRKSEYGTEDGQFFLGKIPTGSGTIQFSDGTTPVPPQYSILSLMPVGGTAVVDHIIYQASEKFEAGGETLAMIAYAKKVGTGS